MHAVFKQALAHHAVSSATSGVRTCLLAPLTSSQQHLACAFNSPAQGPALPSRPCPTTLSKPPIISATAWQTAQRHPALCSYTQPRAAGLLFPLARPPNPHWCGRPRMATTPAATPGVSAGPAGAGQAGGGAGAGPAGGGADASQGPSAASPAPRVTRVAVGQMTSGGDQQANLATCTRLAEDASSRGAKVLFLPECFSFIGTSQQEALSAVQPLDGPLMHQYQELARRTGLWLSLGGFQETGPDPSHTYNTHVMLSDQGELVAHYRKVHLFDVDVPNGPVLMESRTTAAGDKLVVCDTPAGRVGMTICYDLRFPELYQQLTWDMGAQIITMPSAFTKITGAAHWEVLLRARAIECQAWVVAAAQAGRHNEKRESYGHSLVVDPWGSVVARLEDPLSTGIALADIDLDQLQAVRTKMPIAQHRAKGHAAYFHKQ